MVYLFKMDEGDPTDLDGPDADMDPIEVAEMFSSVADLAISELGVQQVRDLLDAIIELGGRERN